MSGDGNFVNQVCCKGSTALIPPETAVLCGRETSPGAGLGRRDDLDPQV